MKQLIVRIIRGVLLGILISLVIVAVGIQFVPVTRDNPPAPASLKAEPAVMELLRTSCYDCHSNETVWPWYSYVAPVSWLVTKDVSEAREHLNFSMWEGLPPDKRADLAEEIIEEVEDGLMPLPNYVKMHPEAALSAAGARRIGDWAAQFIDAVGEHEEEGAGEEDREEEGEHEHEHEHEH